MSGLKRMTFIFSLLVGMASLAQTRMIPHVSKVSGGFTPGLIIANTDHDSSHTVSLVGYQQDGTAMEAVSATIDSGVTQYQQIEDVFGTSDVSHFTISGDSDIQISITYQSTQGQSSPVHVSETSDQASAWRVYPGNWDIVWDGLAIVNKGSGQANITLIQRAADGSMVASYEGLSDVAPYAKVLYVLGTDFTAQEGSYFEIIANQPVALVSLRGTYNWSEYQYLWENKPTEVKVDFHASITNYKGAETCLSCHEGIDQEVMSTTHYQFTAELAENYIYDEEGNPVERKYTGKFWKLCGFPTALPSANWVGKLKDDPATPYVDNPGGCGKCHIGIGMAPAIMKGLLEPAASEVGTNIDCLICHASDYSRKYYIATTAGEPDLNASGAPICFIAPRVDGEFDFSIYNEAARTVGRTTAETCRRCHAKAGGGGQSFDGVLFNFKRGDAFHPDYDVHASAGMDCNDCHFAQNHQMQRGVNNDLSAYDNKLDQSLCINCHGETPHDNFMYNMHTASIACQTCHATTKGGVTYKDMSVVTCPSGDCSPESMNTYGVQMTKFPEDFALTYRWFDGTVQAPIHPLGDSESGKIFPFKQGIFNQPKDANENPIPLKWGKIFVAGDLDAGIATGRSLYESYVANFQGDPAEFGLPEVPGEFDHFGETEDLFSISHGITKTGALTCAQCHSADNSVLDWDALGIANPNPM